MSTMREPNPIAIAISDLHLSLLQPACRADKDWMEVQAHYLKQVRDWTDPQELPILCAGDIFDRWNAPPELINFALEHLPNGMLCIPGQHDLPLHRMDLMHRSGYGVLKRVGKIRDLSDGPHETENLVVFGFGWEQEITPLNKRRNDKLHIALVHKYVALNRETAFPNATKECFLNSKLEKVLKTYDAVCIGDNHTPWMT